MSIAPCVANYMTARAGLVYPRPELVAMVLNMPTADSRYPSLQFTFARIRTHTKCQDNWYCHAPVTMHANRGWCIDAHERTLFYVEVGLTSPLKSGWKVVARTEGCRCFSECIDEQYASLKG
jgi:hypothetical protein